MVKLITVDSKPIKANCRLTWITWLIIRVQKDWSRADQMAYWINAYNAFTIKLIVDNYPVNSIMDLHGGKPWDVKWIKLGGTRPTP